MHERKALFEPKGILLAVGAVLIAAGFYRSGSGPASASAQAPPKREAAAGVRTERIYVPIYSSIFYENGKQTLDLAATLSIHNVNPDLPITVVRADYHNTSGKLIRKYADKPLVLGPLETTNVVIDRSDTAGGTGANFLIEWRGPELAASPLVEAVMINASSNLGIAFTTVGRVVPRPAIAH